MSSGEFLHMEIRKLYVAQEADIIIKKVVLASLAQQINRGIKTSMFRPVFAYGTDTHGDKYTTFATRIAEYLAKNPVASHASIVKVARGVLSNSPIKDDDLAFLPNLIVAWFVAESVRNANSVLTNLMLLDMIENSVELSKDLKDNGISLYNWNDVLTYSAARKMVSTTPIIDGYGALLKDYELGGIHPMAHNRSENQCRPLKPGIKLTVVQQKEGSLIAHWLYEYLQYFFPEIKVNLFSISEAPLDIDIFYNEQDISLKLKQLNLDLKKQESTIDALEKQGKDTSKCTERKQSIKSEIERLKRLEIEYKKINSNKSILVDIIKQILYQRLNSVLNILNIAPESSIRDLFQRLQIKENFSTTQDLEEIKSAKNEKRYIEKSVENKYDKQIEFEKNKKSITTASNMTFIFSSPTTDFATYFLKRKKEGFQFSVIQQNEELLFIECIAVPAGIDPGIALTHLKELKVLLTIEMAKTGKKISPQQIKEQGKFIVAIKGGKDAITEAIKLLKNAGGCIESNVVLSSFTCRIL